MARKAAVRYCEMPARINLALRIGPSPKETPADYEIYTTLVDRLHALLTEIVRKHIG